MGNQRLIDHERAIIDFFYFPLFIIHFSLTPFSAIPPGSLLQL